MIQNDDIADFIHNQVKPANIIESIEEYRLHYPLTDQQAITDLFMHIVRTDIIKVTIS
jgi:hypothetical protein